MEIKYQNFIGVCDSGVGGISVLKELKKRLPGEDFLYYGDSANAPYGEKTTEEVINLTRTMIQSMIEQGVKAIVIACNTATSAAANVLRKEYPNIPILGIEPAVKPAALAHPHGTILALATPITIQLDKYQQLASRFATHTKILSLPCTGLAARIEKGHLEDQDLKDLLFSLIEPFLMNHIDGVVLGCTHYPFVKEQIQSIIGYPVDFYDGGEGTARELERRLKEEHLLSLNKEGKIIMLSSKNNKEELELYRWFYNR